MLYTVRGDGGADGKGGSDESGVGVGGGGLIYSTVSIFGAIFLCLNLILLSVLFVFNEPVYINLMLEDSLFENSTAFLLFLTALLLLAIAMGRSGPGRWLYILGTLAFVFGAGEEISWGQRIFGFETPHYLRDMNTHNEINLHNIKGLDGRLTGIHGAAPRILGVVTAAAYFTRKSSFFGIPFPSVLTMYCFLVANAYTPDSTWEDMHCSCCCFSSPMRTFPRRDGCSFCPSCSFPLLFLNNPSFIRERYAATLGRGPSICSASHASSMRANFFSLLDRVARVCVGISMLQHSSQ